MFLCANVCYLKRMMHLELNDQTSSRQEGETMAAFDDSREGRVMLHLSSNRHLSHHASRSTKTDLYAAGGLRSHLKHTLHLDTLHNNGGIMRAK
jgi:hypothetical protein